MATTGGSVYVTLTVDDIEMIADYFQASRLVDLVISDRETWEATFVGVDIDTGLSESVSLTTIKDSNLRRNFSRKSARQASTKPRTVSRSRR